MYSTNFTLSCSTPPFSILQQQFLQPIFTKERQASGVSIVTTQWAGQPTIMFKFPKGARVFALLQSLQTGSEAPSGYYGHF
jgi:hypothetical protein